MATIERVELVHRGANRVFLGPLTLGSVHDEDVEGRAQPRKTLTGKQWEVLVSDSSLLAGLRGLVKSRKLDVFPSSALPSEG